MEYFQNNTYFTTDREGDTIYVGMLLKLSDVGGTRQKDRLFEYINNGEIKTYIDRKLLTDKAIIFIPDSDTLDIMAKFTLLASAPFTFVFIGSNGNIEQSDIPITLSNIGEFNDMGGDINDFLASQGVEWAESDAFEAGSGEYYLDDAFEGDTG